MTVMNKGRLLKPSKDGYIALSEPAIRGNEWRYIKECLDTNWVSSAGKYVESFEQALAGYLGRKYAVACVNGTAALHTALMVAGIRAGEEVILPALTFIAPANAVRYVNAWPVFIDVEPRTWQLDTQKVADFLRIGCRNVRGSLVNRSTGRKIRGILPVHLLGHSVDMDPIREIAERFGLVVIEDAAESLGALYKGRKVGSLGDIACLSFNGNKIITCGGGGMILTDNARWADKARYFTTQAKDDPLEYIHHEIGFNYRLTNIQAAMGLAQFENLEKYIAVKRNIASRYNAALRSIGGITLPQEAKWAKSIFWLYTILVDSREYGMSSRQLLRSFEQRNIQSRPLWHPLASLKPFNKCYAYRVDVAEQLFRDGLSLPSSVGLKEKEQYRVSQEIAKLRGK